MKKSNHPVRLKLRQETMKTMKTLEAGELAEAAGGVLTGACHIETSYTLNCTV